MRATFLSVLVAVVVMLPVAAAQDPPTATATATINGLPAGITDLASNATKDVAFTVDFSGSNFVCPQGGTGTVTVSISPSSPPGYMTITLEPTEGTFTLDAAPSTSHSGSVPFTLKVTTTEINANASVKIDVSASVALASGAAPCLPSLPASPTVAPATTFANVTFTPPPPPTPEPPAESPGFTSFAAILGVVAVAIVLRRRAA